MSNRMESKPSSGKTFGLHDLLPLLEEERRYVVELWTVLQDVRLWAQLNKLELPQSARPNSTFNLDQHSKLQSRHKEIEQAISEAVIHT
ncbi:hypothetical protein [Collimonas humicola]|uniref:hypothetical protein n=1 Tax=Collimonas humicola TaxID=2825886 RepID=UPI001B8C9BBF|nr:hypothetical protein [Collimonas humicola]